MFDFLRNLTKSAEEKRQEALNAYLDDALTPRQRRQFEQELSQDTGLQAELDDLRFFKQQLRQLPQRRVPHNFTLDPAVYAPPAKQPLFQFYPVLQGATVLTAFFFVVVLALGIFSQTSNDATVAFAPAAESGIVAQGSDAAAETVEETAVEEEAMADEVMVEEESADEEEAMAEAAEDVAVEATAVSNFQAEVTSEVAPEEPMEEEGAEEYQEVVEDTTTSVASPTADAVTTDEASTPDEGTSTGESEESPPPVVGAAGNEAATAAPEPTISPPATATVSTIPRVSETATAVPDRALPTATPLPTETAVPPTDDDAQITAIPPASLNFQEDGSERVLTSYPPPQPPPSSNNTLRTIQIVLGVLLLAFGLTTFLVRRRM